MVEITDRNSAEAWLETQTYQTQVWFAARCALRALPALGKWEGATSSGLALASLRAMFISAGAGTCPPAEMNKLSAPARSAARSAYSAASAAASAACSAAASAAASAARSAAADSAASAARSAYSAACSAAADSAACSADSAATNDANAPGSWAPLWASSEQPPELIKAWAALKQQWDADAADWSFWIEWYEAILNGDPLPWDLTQRIALEVTEDEWDAGPGVVAARIGQIRAKWQLEKEVERLKEQLAGAVSQSVAHRKHNNPPPLDDDLEIGPRTITLIWDAIYELEEDIAKPAADPSAIKRIALTLWAISAKIAVYCGGKIDTTLEAAAKELGSSGTKWVLGAGATYWVSTLEGTQSVAKLAWQYAEKILVGG